MVQSALNVSDSKKKVDDGRAYNELLSFMQHLYSSGSLTSIPVQRYQDLFGTLMRDETQIMMPKDESDIFAEELMILIQSLVITQNQ